MNIYQGKMPEKEWASNTHSSGQDTFEMLKKACLEALCWAFANFDKAFLLETDASKLGLGAVLSQKQNDSQHQLVAYARNP